MLLFLCTLVSGQVKIDELHGDEMYSYQNFHSGNQIRTSFYNEGYVGRRNTNPDDIGEWPINSGHSYINLITYFIGAEVKDTDGIIRHIVSEANGVATGNDSDPASGDSDDLGNWQCNAPLPGFANDDVQKIAMSHQPETWPATWPDKFDDVVDPGWPDAWNGYFGKNILNADQESYYVFDDYLNSEWAFYPDSTDSLRRGLGLRGTVRGFQWSNVLVEDILFQLVDVKNIGTTDHAKLNFGIISGPVIGRAENVGGAGDGGDDGASYNLEQKLGWHWDLDDIGQGGWTPVGKHGFGFYESPGNPYDGIDNDDDANLGPGPVITTEMFAPIVINAGDPIILIDYNTFEREHTTMPSEGITITYLDNTYHFDAGQEFVEVPSNLIDDNFNGIIDENNGYEFGEGADAVANYLYVGRKYVDYFTGEGLDNILLDERRDDGIDNDEDWSIDDDDVGLDGVPNTGDPGEGDGLPTSGAGTDLPGEPHIDKTDIDESDMIGLTAFNIFSWGNPKISDDEGLWEAIMPGFLNAFGQYGDTDLMLGSGYFPLAAGDIERFSIGIMFGDSDDDLFTNNRYARKTYNENYNFAKAPKVPTLTLVPGDNRVTLIWDDAAEYSKDPITGYDFEGYRIYRSTDPGWNDMSPITDGGGSIAYRKPLAQFDLENGLVGFHPVDVRGVQFYLGDDTGIVHSFVDTTARNGQLYYYAVTSYDHGDAALGVAPSECSKYLSISRDGAIDKGRNVGIAKPESPVLGFLEAQVSNPALRHGGAASGKLGYEIVNPMQIKEGHIYNVVFEDTLVQTAAKALTPTTKNFSLIDVSTGDTLINKSTTFGPEDEQPVTDGFQLQLVNVPELTPHPDSTFWSSDSIYAPIFAPFKYSRTVGTAMAHDYLIEIGEVGVDTSTEIKISRTKKLPAIPVNFRVRNTLTDEYIDFGFWERDALDGEKGKFTAFTAARRSDQIIFLEKNAEDSLIMTWNFMMDIATNDSAHRGPKAGDFMQIKTVKPFLSNDIFEFTTSGQKVDSELAKNQMNMIRVVPNPYVVSNSWEPVNPYSSGRGPRELHFIHLPQQCTISIFNVRGQLVRKIDYYSPNVNDGTYVWDMLSKDLLDISYGIYIYHIDAGELGQKTGKFAVVK